jgi:glycosyltransferase involved in cell wall biosynthesis
MSDRSISGRLGNVWLRASARLERVAGAWFGVELPGQLGFLTRRLLRTARSRRADLYSLHVDQALWVGRWLLEDGRRVSCDVEDWYSEDGLPEDRATRPIGLMKACERALLRGAAHVTTTSRSLAERLTKEYGCSVPQVVYNSFPTEERAHIDGRTVDRRDRRIPSIIWFSQTIGPGRGLEDLLSALSGIDGPFELHLRGTPRAGFESALLAAASPELRGRMHFHPQVPQEELLSRLAEHDIGYCGELSDCASRDLTITNKVFEYMRAGLAIVASDTSGQKEVSAQAPNAVRIFRQGDRKALREAIEGLLSDPAELAAAKAASLAALERHFDWSQSKRRLQALFAESTAA